MKAVYELAAAAGQLCDQLLSHGTVLFMRVERADVDEARKGPAMEAMMQADQLLEQGTQRLREGLALLQQSILSHPEGF